MLELFQLKRVYEQAGLNSFIAVDTVDLTIRRGDFISIIGRSGSGKSTLLSMIVGMLRPTSGNILIDGIDLWAMNDKNMAKIRGSKIGYIPQGPNLLSNLTILDNIRLPFCLAQKKGNGIDRALNLLEKMGIGNLAIRYPAQLSGGEMRKVAIARALINNPDILVADEPTNDLDEETAQEVMKLFSEISCQGMTILMVTHDYDYAGYGNRICAMSSGKLFEQKAAYFPANAPRSGTKV